MAGHGEPRVVLVHDWLTGMRGGEKCLEVFCRRWPSAPLFTLLHRRGALIPAIERRPIHTSPLNVLPAVHRYYRYLLPIMPALATAWRLPPCDLVLSMSHCVAKSARPPQGVPHICYCFTPMRYAWHMRTSYFQQQSGLKGRLLDHLLHALRAWDRRTADRVTHFVANSKTVRQRIRESYDRASEVIYPPVDTEFYTPAAFPREDYYLAVSAFAPYKRLDLAIAACNATRRRLVIIGTGQDERRLRAMAGPTIHFLGWQPDSAIRDHLRRCQALLFPGEEDFGIVPVEANACGTPVIAYGRGGATETIVPPGAGAEPTGLWFEEQTTECLSAALAAFEKRTGDFRPAAARRQALRFNGQRFAEEFFACIDRVLHPRQAALRRAA